MIMFFLSRRGTTYGRPIRDCRSEVFCADVMGGEERGEERRGEERRGEERRGAERRGEEVGQDERR